jgi:hypothetical protein
VESPLYRYRRGFSRNVVISIVLEIGMLHGMKH